MGILLANFTDEPYASHINNTPKYVVSTSLGKVEWKNSTLIKGNLAKEIARLKQQPGKNIGTAGSPTLVHSLLHNDLLDELILMIYPVVVGKGKRFFKESVSQG
jgi:dihydrofolate reductase